MTLSPAFKEELAPKSGIQKFGTKILSGLVAAGLLFGSNTFAQGVAYSADPVVDASASTDVSVIGRRRSDDSFFYSPNQSAHQGHINAINAAKKTIHMTMYHMSDPAVAAALANAAKRGVDTRVIFDKGQWKAPADAQLVATLTAAGVQVKTASPKFSITHMKAMTIDGNLAMISTMNVIKTYMDMLDFGVFVTDANIIAEMDSVFATDWQNSIAGTGDTPALTVPNLVWSPVNSADRIIALIKTANKSISLMVESLSYTDVISALEEAAQRGVQVRVLVPKCYLGPVGFNQPATSALRAAHVDARMVPGPATSELPYVHAKAIIVDSATVLLGSENYSFNSLEQARELSVILNNPAVAADVQSLFDQLWPQSELPPATDKYACVTFPPGPSDTTVSAPVAAPAPAPVAPVVPVEPGHHKKHK